MKTLLDITINRLDFVGKSVPSIVCFKIFVDIHVVFELELRGLENADYLIPLGCYSGIIRNSPKFGKDAIYIDVPGRSGIMFHVGNSIHDSRGCVLLGLTAPCAMVVSQSGKAISLIDALIHAYKIDDIRVLVDDDLPF